MSPNFLKYQIDNPIDNANAAAKVDDIKDPANLGPILQVFKEAGKTTLKISKDFIATRNIKPETIKFFSGSIIKPRKSMNKKDKKNKEIFYC